MAYLGRELLSAFYVVACDGAHVLHLGKQSKAGGGKLLHFLLALSQALLHCRLRLGGLLLRLLSSGGVAGRSLVLARLLGLLATAGAEGGPRRGTMHATGAAHPCGGGVLGCSRGHAGVRVEPRLVRHRNRGSREAGRRCLRKRAADACGTHTLHSDHTVKRTGMGGKSHGSRAKRGRVVATTCAQAKLRLANGATCAEQPTGDIYNFLSVNDLIITLAAQGLFPQMMMRPLDGVTPLTRSVLPRTTKPVTDGCRGAPVYSPLSQVSPAFLHPVRSILRFCAEIRTEPSADGGKHLLATSSTPPLPFEAQTMNQRQRPPF